MSIVIDKIERLKNNLILLKNNELKNIIIQTILEEEKLVLQLNKEQLDRGKDSTGNNIEPKYSEAYAKKKGFTTPDLEVSGDFKEAFELEVFGQAADIFSTDFKSPFLEARYDRGKIYGLDDNSKIILIKRMIPTITLKSRKFILTN